MQINITGDDKDIFHRKQPGALLVYRLIFTRYDKFKAEANIFFATNFAYEIPIGEKKVTNRNFITTGGNTPEPTCQLE